MSMCSTCYTDSHDIYTNRFSTGRQMNNMTKKCPGSSQRTFIPFGQGAHSCVGMRLAVMCIKLSLTEVIQRFRFSRAPKSQVYIHHHMCIARPVAQRFLPQKYCTHAILWQSESAPNVCPKCISGVYTYIHTYTCGVLNSCACRPRKKQACQHRISSHHMLHVSIRHM